MVTSPAGVHSGVAREKPAGYLAALWRWSVPSLLLSDTRFHDLRRTCATLLLTRGVYPKILSEMLGHSSIAIMLDTYSHVIPGVQEVAANAMEDALS